MEGDRLVNTPYSIKFRVDKENEILCSRELTAKDLKKFRKAVKKDYYFQVCLLNLPSCFCLLCSCALCRTLQSSSRAVKQCSSFID